MLAKNGTIGAPPVGGRRRRRRGNTDSVSVAELTGEIPIVCDHDIADVTRSRNRTRLADEHETDEPTAVTTNGVVDHRTPSRGGRRAGVDDTDTDTDRDRHRRPR